LFSLGTGFYENAIETGPHAVRRTAYLGGGLPSEVDTRAFCRASKTGKVRAKLAKSAKCAAFMILFRQNRDVV
jgi:hypothetical protein